MGASMLRRYVTADVFADRPFGGNPVAVVLDADGLTDPQMQALAAEFNYIETTFVLPARKPDHTAHVRIFTPDREVPFAGHPNIGTAFQLARHRIAEGGSAPRRFQFEEAAGLVEIELMVENDEVVGAELLAPEALSRATIVAPDAAAACIGLDGQDVRTVIHGPQVISVGLPFLTVELHSRDALRRARPDRRAYDELFPLDGAKAVYLYTRDDTSHSATTDMDLSARMFTFRLVEDPATGSAAAALAALLSDVQGADVALRIRQGEDMGRPSTVVSRSVRDGSAVRAKIRGRCAEMFTGTFDLD
ncbi:PhzF family phenazine biosynthesis protein [Mycolicibacterium mageritense]|uniref:PhzF family phenazine biosynthesis protein n=1 Tax=Mycolicibacterium mageritense TaxID=53462 RepID=UPI0023F24181|nr:PhzF family phenazine biosynthesis protein [Mycolicibacterium mageritense]